jgi:hypothetical protein
MGRTIISYILWQRQLKLQHGRYELSKGVFNLYIAFGALILTLGGALTNFGLSTLVLSQMIGAVFMYFGFIESDKITLEKLLFFLKIRPVPR